MENKVVYIYGLREVGTEEFRYIGKTVKPRKRLEGHKTYARKSPTTHCGCWIKSLLNEGKEIEMEIIDECTKADWEEVEIKYIALFKSIGAKLTNHSSGGQAPPRMEQYSLERQEEIKSKLAKNRSIPPNRKGAKMPESAIKIIVKNLKRNDKKINQLSLEGEFIKEWNSISEACRHFNVTPSGISKVINGKGETSCGFKWELVK